MRQTKSGQNGVSRQVGKMNYSYPIEETWTKDEIVNVIHFFEMVEKAYETGVKAERVLQAYNRFKQIVPSKSEEKTYFRQFEKDAGYPCYKVVQKAKAAGENEKINCQT